MQVNLVYFRAKGEAKVISVPAIPAVIGRGDDCDVKAPVKGISRRHCQLFDDGGRLSVRDLESSNGTYVNGDRVDSLQLDPGDVIKLGDLSLSVQIDGLPENPSAAKPEKAAAPAKPAAPADIMDSGAEDSEDVDDFISMMFDDDDDEDDI